MRFTETLSTGIVTDHITGKEYNCEMRIDDKLLELLNELHEENQDLKAFNQDLSEELSVCGNARISKDICIEKLIEENKELKQSNERLLKMLDNVANYMQRENKYMPIDDFTEWWNGIATKGLDGDME